MLNSDIQSYNQKLTTTDQSICDALATTISAELSDAENKIWHRHPVWFLEGNPVVGYAKLKNCVQLLFWSGQSFDEAGLNPEGSFKAAEKRYTDLDQIDQVELRRWLSKARQIQWDYKNIVKHRGVLERIK